MAVFKIGPCTVYLPVLMNIFNTIYFVSLKKINYNKDTHRITIIKPERLSIPNGSKLASLRKKSILFVFVQNRHPNFSKYLHAVVFQGTPISNTRVTQNLQLPDFSTKLSISHAVCNGLTVLPSTGAEVHICDYAGSLRTWASLHAQTIVRSHNCY